MADAALRKLWADVRQDFDRARAMFPAQPVEREGHLTQLGEWLDHNELELALDELESLGEDNAAPTAYWMALQSAAERMGLSERAHRLNLRVTGGN